MLIWVEDNDLSFWEKADNGADIFSYVCFAAQNETDLVDLYDFAVAHGAEIDWPEEAETRARVEAGRASYDMPFPDDIPEDALNEDELDQTDNVQATESDDRAENRN